jgi:hypothetical protein
MNMLKRVVYMGLGALLALGVAIGAIAVLAQEDEPEEATPETDEESEYEALPGLRFHRGWLGEERDDMLAEALGITVEELDAAVDEAYAAALEQAVAEGLLTQEQAAELLDSPFRFRFPLLGLADKNELLAEALGITVEELEEAQAEVRAARLAALVETGILTQEQADLIAARQAMRNYVDPEALAETLQNAYQDAVDAALADGAITEAQAEQLLEEMPTFQHFEFFGHGFGRARGHHGFGFGRGLPDIAPGADIVLPSAGAGA